MRKQYHFRPSQQGFHAWDVDPLVEKSRDLPHILVKLEDIKELDENYWYQEPGAIPTCRSLAEHFKLALEADLDYPIILSQDGRVMDGMHRVMKALASGYLEIKAVKFREELPPDYEDVYPVDLLYEGGHIIENS